VVGGLLEVAVASDVGMRIDLDAIPVRPEVRVVCEHVGIDPYTSISEGTLIATLRPDRAIGYVEACAREGIDAAIVGDVTEPADGRVLVDGDGVERALEHPGLDPFWGAFGAWASEAAVAG
jgi:hydrogenase maturation factor